MSDEWSIILWLIGIVAFIVILCAIAGAIRYDNNDDNDDFNSTIMICNSMIMDNM